MCSSYIFMVVDLSFHLVCPPYSVDSTTTRPKVATPLFSLGRTLAISSILVISCYILFFDRSHSYQPSILLSTLKQSFPAATSASPHIGPRPTNLSHIVIGIVGSMNTWEQKNSYVTAWWRPNVTRSYLFLDRALTGQFLPWPSSFPPFRVNEDITGFQVYPKIENPVQVRMIRTILEMFREGDKDVRWYVMADDDTVLVIDNLVEVLGKYDHTKYHYIGTSSECVKSNSDFSFGMAFGGAGYALSYPLVAALSTKLDGCVERYPYLRVSDLMLHECLTDLGAVLTQEKGFHQIDLHGHISGLLSSHPQSPFLSLHHLDTVDPIFPTKNGSESINHLMKAAKVDPSRLLQQTICYDRPSNSSFSISWGYSAQIYERFLPRSTLRRPIETFRPWQKSARVPFYMFDTRRRSDDPCQAPHVFYFESVSDDHRVTTYSRGAPRGLGSCYSSGNNSVDSVSEIRVYSSPDIHLEMGGKECCDIEHAAGTNVTRVLYRPCMDAEIIA